MDHVVSLTSSDVLDKNLTELCRVAGKVLFKGTDPKLLLSGMSYPATRESCEGSQKVYRVRDVLYLKAYTGTKFSKLVSIRFLKECVERI